MAGHWKLITGLTANTLWKVNFINLSILCIFHIVSRVYCSISYLNVKGNFYEYQPTEVIKLKCFRDVFQHQPDRAHSGQVSWVPAVSGGHVTTGTSGSHQNCLQLCPAWCHQHGHHYIIHHHYHNIHHHHHNSVNNNFATSDKNYYFYNFENYWINKKFDWGLTEWSGSHPIYLKMPSFSIYTDAHFCWKFQDWLGFN